MPSCVITIVFRSNGYVAYKLPFSDTNYLSFISYYAYYLIITFNYRDIYIYIYIIYIYIYIYHLFRMNYIMRRSHGLRTRGMKGTCHFQSFFAFNH